MIAVIDYGMGNLRSVQKALQYVGYDAVITDDKNKIKDSGYIILPGVGAAEDAMTRLSESGLDRVIHEEVKKGKPFLGICLGMQLLFDESFENGRHKCLGLVSGSVKKFNIGNDNYRIPHMGWNSININDEELFKGINRTPYMYFVHSYHAVDVPRENIISDCEYGYNFVCGVRKDNIMGLQFHPEKSGDEGLIILKNFGGIS